MQGEMARSAARQLFVLSKVTAAASATFFCQKRRKRKKFMPVLPGNTGQGGADRKGKSGRRQGELRLGPTTEFQRAQLLRLCVLCLLRLLFSRTPISCGSTVQPQSRFTFSLRWSDLFWSFGGRFVLGDQRFFDHLKLGVDRQLFAD
jgi:hypothetical protein